MRQKYSQCCDGRVEGNGSTRVRRSWSSSFTVKKLTAPRLGFLVGSEAFDDGLLGEEA